MSWHTVRTIATRATAELITAAGPDRLTGVRVIEVDEHRWAPRRLGADGFATKIIDLKPVADKTGPARLLDLVPVDQQPCWPTDWPPNLPNSPVLWG